MKTLFQRPRSLKREVRIPTGEMLAGKLHPAMAVDFGQSEGGVVSQAIDINLEPIAGRMLSTITGEVNCVFVPNPAIDALKNPEDDLPMNSEAYRKKLIENETLTDLEAPTDISDNLDIIPIKVSGNHQVDERGRLAYLVAVNLLRQRAYYKATLLDATETAIQPALFAQSVLDMYAGVLNPEDRVNGAVPFQGPDTKIYLKGMGKYNATFSQVNANGRESDGTTNTYANSVAVGHSTTSDYFYVEENPDNAGYPNLHVNLAETELGNLKTSDFYTAERMDQLTRLLDAQVKANPLHGQQMALRLAHGLSVDNDNQPMVIYSKRVAFNESLRAAMDGANLDKEYTNHSTRFNYTVPIPRTEFGGVLITMISVKPDETLDRMPHPTLTRQIAPKNYLSDEAKIDPVPVIVRQLDADVDTGSENTVAMHVGNNHLELNYQSHGFNAAVDATRVAEKSAVWSVGLPTSLTPESINYPSPVDIYPFVLNDDTDPVATYRLTSVASIPTPLLRGPTPVEEMEIIEDESLFEGFE